MNHYETINKEEDMGRNSYSMEEEEYLGNEYNPVDFTTFSTGERKIYHYAKRKKNKFERLSLIVLLIFGLTLTHVGIAEGSLNTRNDNVPAKTRVNTFDDKKVAPSVTSKDVMRERNMRALYSVLAQFEILKQRINMLSKGKK